MQSKSHAEEYSPKQDAPASKNQERDSENDQGDVIIAINPDVITVLNQIRSVPFESGLIVVLRGTAQNPTDVCPPAAIARSVRIAEAIGVRMVYAMRYDPLNRSALNCERAARHQKIFNCFRYFIAPVS